MLLVSQQLPELYLKGTLKDVKMCVTTLENKGVQLMHQKEVASMSVVHPD